MTNTLESFQSNVFNAINISNIVWIDDYFSKGLEEEQFIDKLKTEITLAHELEETENLRNIEELSDIDFDDPLDVILDSLPSDSATVLQILDKISTTPELNQEAFDKFSALFNKHANLEKLSLDEWNKEKEVLIKKDDCLFFIDLDFSNEGAAKDYGKEILKYILNNSDNEPYCVLFTHNCLHGAEEEQQRSDIINGFNDETPTNFSVLSKSIFNEGDDLEIDFKAPEILKRAYIRKLCHDLSNSISDELKSSIEEVTESLSQCSIYEIDFSIFRKTISEGASEFDVLHRIYSLNQKKVISNLIKDGSPLVERIRNLRKIESINFQPQNRDEKPYFLFYKDNSTPGDFFKNLRNREMWSDGNSINRIHTPINTGDTFYFNSGGEEYNYVLLEQSCDLMIRDDGSRKLNEAVLIPFESKKFKKNDPKLKEYQGLTKNHVFQSPLDREVYFVFDFSKSINTNINYLDLCVFNSNGELSLHSEDEECSQLVFNDGLLKKYKELRDKFFSPIGSFYLLMPPENICHSVSNMTINGDTCIKVSFDRDSDTVSVNGKRGDRLNSPFTDILLNKLYQHKTRPPLSHDFSDTSLA
ncbi:hypothetical protein [Motiliproteus sp. MSK22-1]|uniref:hypothetical protein n=1 Tax=Motiliproteus sp. MSK22-1 TaxID=1897630 RepID=UPI00097669A1|nr:hypothetical protein [Motiliproteus sp. MSK22-1]OMH39603.1 hypothetical protein BGP75_01780 [Motiliproteus sp. MSK22-1]